MKRRARANFVRSLEGNRGLARQLKAIGEQPSLLMRDEMALALEPEVRYWGDFGDVK